jgi:hypothetical protein
MTTQILLAALRHAIGALGGALAGQGLATRDENEAALGAAGILASYGWSVYRKWKRAQGGR